jgi:hypothetical protein
LIDDRPLAPSNAEALLEALELSGSGAPSSSITAIVWNGVCQPARRGHFGIELATARALPPTDLLPPAERAQWQSCATRSKAEARLAHNRNLDPAR